MEEQYVVAVYDDLKNSCFRYFRIIRPPPRNVEHTFMEQLLSDLQGHSMAWPFQEPVKAEDVADYYDVIKNPMGLSPTCYT